MVQTRLTLRTEQRLLARASTTPRSKRRCVAARRARLAHLPRAECVIYEGRQHELMPSRRSAPTWPGEQLAQR